MKRTHVLFGLGVAALIAAVATARAYYDDPAAKPATGPTDVVRRLEALKARRKAIDREIREAQAELAEQIGELRERAAKAGVVVEMPPAPPHAPRMTCTCTPTPAPVVPPPVVPAPVSAAGYTEPPLVPVPSVAR